MFVVPDSEGVDRKNKIRKPKPQTYPRPDFQRNKHGNNSTGCAGDIFVSRTYYVCLVGTPGTLKIWLGGILVYFDRIVVALHALAV
jgi:hypothetical protein